MKKNTLFVVLFAMLCLAAITAVVSADNDGYNSFCYIDQYGCWVTDWDVERDEPTGKKIYVQFWSEEAREFFMGKDSDATVAPLPRKYGATMTMFKGDEAARGAWKSGLWGFQVVPTVFDYWAFDPNLSDADWKWDFDTYKDQGVAVGTKKYYYWGDDGRHPAHVEKVYVNLANLNEPWIYDPMNDVFETTYSVNPKDGVARDNDVLKYCRGHIEDGGCVLPGSLVRDISASWNQPTWNTDDSGWAYTWYRKPTGKNTWEWATNNVIWANPFN